MYIFEYLLSTRYTIYTVVLCGMSTAYKEYDYLAHASINK